MKTELEPIDSTLKETIENNYLNRNQKLIMLAKLLLNVKDNITISIDGRWGCGKSFFVKQFKYLTEHIIEFNNQAVIRLADKEIFKRINDNSIIVYYNAWENDMHENVLESLIYNILNEYSNMKDQIISIDEFKGLFKRIFNDVIAAGTFQAVNLENFDKIKSYKDLAKEIVTIEEKKDSFNKLIDNILGNKKRLILIIDELDRCKPDYAVKVLETVKHFYSNKKISTIFSTNNMELSNTIKKFYGYDFDGYGYLNKFYDFVISLDSVDIKDYLQKQLNFCKNTWIYHDMSFLIMSYFNFSLRECNRYITLYNMLQSYIEREEKFFEDKLYLYTCILVPIALALKIKNIKEYNLFMNGSGKEILINFFDSKIENTNYKSWVKEILKMGKDDNYKEKIISEYQKLFSEKRKVYDFPFFDVLSLLGNDVVVNE